MTTRCHCECLFRSLGGSTAETLATSALHIERQEGGQDLLPVDVVGLRTVSVEGHDPGTDGPR